MIEKALEKARIVNNEEKPFREKMIRYLKRTFV